MSRHNTRRRNLNSQLKQRIDEINRIGESHHQAKIDENIKFGEAVEGIHSISTMKNYNQVARQFLKYAKENGAGNRADLQETIKEHGVNFLKFRENSGLSTYTLKRDRAALNKLMKNETLTYTFENIDKNEITRSRNNRNQNNVNFNEKLNADLVSLAKGTGGRRSDLAKLKKEDFYEKNGRMYVEFKQSKGGRDRIALVRKEHQEAIQDRLNRTGKGMKLFARINGHADIHSYRREYAQELYKDVIADESLAQDLKALYPPRNEPNVKIDTYTTQGQDNVFSGYRDDIYLVSQALGHNRLDVAVDHYLR